MISTVWARKRAWCGLASLLGIVASSAPSDAASTAVVRRSAAGGTLTPEDRRALRELGLPNPTDAVVVARTLPRSADGRERARLHGLAQAPQGFGPSAACDTLSASGEARALCRGHVDGPLGSADVRMQIEATLGEGADGSLHLVLRNASPLEAKGVFSWSPVVAPRHMLLSYDLVPAGDGWRTEARVGVEMLAHEDAACDVSASMLKVEAWLSREISR